ncbi:MAG: ADP-dependent glucokinase/phosphofructokinase [Mycobacteriales bacterium]
MVDQLERYRATLKNLDDVIAGARLTLLGFSVAVDAVHRLTAEQIAAIYAHATTDDGKPGELCRGIWELVRSGTDGEVWVDWPQASQWLISRLPTHYYSIGGNAGQAANVLSVLGVRSLLALTDRRPTQLATLGSSVRLAAPDGSLIAPAQAQPTPEPGRPAHHVVEFSAGTPLPPRCGAEPATISRSGRVIMRFAYDGPAYDEDFARAARERAGHAGAGLVTGLNKVPPHDVDHAYQWCRQRAAQWREAGVEFVHHEVSDYPRQLRTVRELAPSVNSLGLSERELVSLSGWRGDPADRAAALLIEYGLDRVTVHGDRWALAVSTADPERELHTLLVACLLAGARAQHGEPVRPVELPPLARLLPTDELPPPARHPGLSSVCIPTLWQRRPAATVGLGDTFVAGTLLALGSSCPPLAV